MSFNLEYRPTTFDQVAGNKGTISSLQSILKQEKCPHILLFSGPSGCGKTTLARITAKELQCSEHDVIEINSANNRGIDTARDIIQQMYYKPLHGPIKVYILDEVHQTSKDFQNAMLKALEEPPSHVYFMLCTTEPEKLIATIRNRATMFTVEKLDEQKIIRLLWSISKNEGNEIDKTILAEIASESEGSPRQAVIMLQKIIGLTTEEEMKEAIQAIKINEKNTIDLCRALLKGASWKSIAAILKLIQDDPEKVRRAVLGYMSAVLLNSGEERAAMIIECFADNYYNSGKAGLIFSCFSVIS
jgi:DNA polymerase III subunit gamma/tau